MSIKHVIGIVAPSSPVPDGLIKQSVEYFQKLGFKVKRGKHLDKKELFAAGTGKINKGLMSICAAFYNNK